MVLSVAFSPDGNTLAAASRDQSAILWDLATGKARQTLEGPGWVIFFMAYSPDGKTLAASGPGASGKLRIWDSATGNVQDTLETNVRNIYSVAFSADGKRLVLGSQQGTVKLW